MQMPGKGGGTRKRGRDPFKICSLRVPPLHTCASLLREKSINHSKNGPFQGGEEEGDTGVGSSKGYGDPTLSKVGHIPKQCCIY